MPDINQLWTAIVSNPLIQLSVRLAGLYVLAIYLAMVFWTLRDAQQRTENQLLPYLAGLMVVVLNIFGLFLYLIVRPKETLGEAYERQRAVRSWVVFGGAVLMLFAGASQQNPTLLGAGAGGLAATCAFIWWGRRLIERRNQEARSAATELGLEYRQQPPSPELEDLAGEL